MEEWFWKVYQKYRIFTHSLHYRLMTFPHPFIGAVNQTIKHRVFVSSLTFFAITVLALKLNILKMPCIYPIILKSSASAD
jgi:hypothetical protein